MFNIWRNLTAIHSDFLFFTMLKPLLLLICFIILGCNSTDVTEKFNQLKNENFSDFKGHSITYRKGIYLLSKADDKKDKDRIFVKKNFGEIIYIKNSENKNIERSSASISSLKTLLNKFDQLNVANVSVDKFNNIQYVFFTRNCQYTFLKLADENTLKMLKKEYFEKYVNDWYLQKSCAE